MKIAVFCSSSSNIADRYKQLAYQLGAMIAANGDVLVYGGATGGLMDAVAKGAFDNKAEVIGVIAEAIIKMNRQSSYITQLITVDTLSDRKLQMKLIADAFIVLPGSFGTLDEMMDIVAGGIVGEHNKPLVIFNQDGFYDLLIEQIELMRNEKFIPEVEKYKPLIATDIDECYQFINFSYKH